MRGQSQQPFFGHLGYCRLEIEAARSGLSEASYSDAATLSRALAEFVFDAVDEGVPTRFNHILVNAHGAPGVAIIILAFDDDANGRGGTGVAVDDADFII